MDIIQNILKEAGYSKNSVLSVKYEELEEEQKDFIDRNKIEPVEILEEPGGTIVVMNKKVNKNEVNKLSKDKDFRWIDVDFGGTIRLQKKVVELINYDRIKDIKIISVGF